MSNGSDQRKLFADMQQSEARLNWSRNSYFLTCSSILLVALSQFKDTFTQGALAILGILLNIAWFLVQFRSSKYILYWKNKEREEAEKLHETTVYPKALGGIEMRKVVFILPIAFILIWSAVLTRLFVNKPYEKLSNRHAWHTTENSEKSKIKHRGEFHRGF